MSNPNGSFSIEPAGPFRAAEHITITMTYTVGAQGIAVGGAVKFGLPNQGWGEPLTPYPRGDQEVYKGEERQICRYKACNTTARVESFGKGSVFLSHRGAQNILGPYNNWSWWITATVEQEALAEGDRIIITYGDTSLGEDGARVQPFAERDRVWFTAFADRNGGGQYEQTEGSPVDCAVIPGKLARVNLTIPSIIRPGVPFAARVSLTDWGMQALPEAPDIEFVMRDGEHKTVETGSFRKRVAGKVISLSSDNDTRYRAGVRTPTGRLISGRSNPAVCAHADGPGLYWGDLHTHSFYHQYNQELGYGDPCTGPDELLRYVREVSHLDFIALTDGRGALPDNAGWEEQQQAVIDNYRPGEFATLKGWEIQMGTDGHRNAIYRTADIEEHYDHPAFADASIWNDAPEAGMQGVLDYYRERNDAFLIPHHPGVWMNWDRFDPAVDRLAEIYSCWGSSEAPHNDYWDKASIPGISVAAGLGRGHRFGFVGGSDSHTGYPGRSLMDADRYSFVRYKAGFTGVWANELTRESIWDALHSRYTYATTGARMIVRFFVDDIRMGGELETATDVHTIEWNATGTEIINRVEILRDGEVVFTDEPYAVTAKGVWEDDSEQAGQAAFYYLRVTQVDGNRAWCSPVFV